MRIAAAFSLGLLIQALALAQEPPMQPLRPDQVPI